MLRIVETLLMGLKLTQYLLIYYDIRPSYVDGFGLSETIVAMVLMSLGFLYGFSFWLYYFYKISTLEERIKNYEAGFIETKKLPPP